jgi:hypothetical protein
MFQKFSLLTLMMIFAAACQSPEETKTPEASTQAPPPPPAAPSVPAIDSMTLAEMMAKVDVADVSFTNLSITTNMSNKDARMIGTFYAPGGVPAINCAPQFGTIVLSGNSSTVATVQVYFAQGCTYLQTYYNDKKYANMMGQPGLNFFNNILTRVQNGQ